MNRKMHSQVWCLFRLNGVGVDVRIQTNRNSVNSSVSSIFQETRTCFVRPNITYVTPILSRLNLARNLVAERRSINILYDLLHARADHLTITGPKLSPILVHKRLSNELLTNDGYTFSLIFL